MEEKKVAKRAKKAPEKKVEVEVKKEKTFKDLRKVLNKDTEVLVMNNTQGHFYYSCPQTRMSINLEAFGETQVVTLELLEIMKRRARVFFENYLIMVIDVFEEDANIQDVIKYLDIQKYYKDIEKLDDDENNSIYEEDFFDNIIINKTKSEFDRIVSKMNKRLLVQFANRCVELYRTGEFDSRYKMDTLSDLLKNEDLFSDIDLSK